MHEHIHSHHASRYVSIDTALTYVSMLSQVMAFQVLIYSLLHGHGYMFTHMHVSTLYGIGRYTYVHVPYTVYIHKYANPVPSPLSTRQPYAYRCSHARGFACLQVHYLPTKEPAGSNATH